ncbi:GNAT family N-acetyltransferase [Actinoplanes sp. KI2]|uniref:GNAT family N-acetyltransferase n=1 Tax=Actinoplanes sp. KI2 TaxID=2983315 RepID=UPI0021D60F0E|nr:GNAT family N-acetyltransferase [Actinoplanes sp. KI2]MCU7730994.1 GNAT family N-acetyltransferase [Actinoplanes sp. KI2]
MRLDLPQDYPREYERELRLADGRRVLIRPIVPADATELGDAIHTADPDTVRRRFLGAPPHITPRLLEHLCTVDYRKRFALVATDPQTGRGVAIARYEATGDEVADVAVAVDPAWRGIGLATALIETLAEIALERGIHAFSAYYLAANRPVAALVGHLGLGGRQIIREGFAEAAVALDRDGVPAATDRRGPSGD